MSCRGCGVMKRVHVSWRECVMSCRGCVVSCRGCGVITSMATNEIKLMGHC